MLDIRNDALTGVMSIMEDKQPSHVVMARYLNGASEASNEDKSFYKKLVQGTVERAITLDYIIDCVSSVKTGKMKPVIRCILRLGTYQIFYMDVPDSAACNESVKLAKKRKFDNLSGFVNGVLRNISRQKDKLISFDIIDKNKLLMAKYSMPEWIVRYFVKNFGVEKTEAAFAYFLTDNKTSIRCNISKIQPDELVARLRNHGINVEPAGAGIRDIANTKGMVDIPSKCLKLSSYSSLYDIPEFNEGLFAVQDLSSVLAGEIAQLEPDYKVLDLCAAPGGKAINIADRLLALKGEGRVTACDISANKVSLVNENINRVGFTNIDLLVNDATVLRENFIKAYDVVICDVPCSGLGIIGKKPDIKYNMTPEGQTALVELQRLILDCAVQYVKPQGQLIFSTCTVNKAENEENVDYIKSKGFKCTGSKQLLPGDFDADGFFYARLVKLEQPN